MKSAMRVNPPEQVWAEIKDEPILIKTSNQKEKTKVIRYSLAASFASLCVIIASVIAFNNDNFFNQPQITGELTTTGSESSSSEKNNTTTQNGSTTSGTTQNESTGTTSQTEGRGDTTQSAITQNPQTSQETQGQTPSTSGNQGDQNMGINIPVYKVWDHKLYTLASDDEMYVQESDIDRKFSQTVNGVEFTVFSIKGVSLSESFAYQANNIYHRYNAIYNGEFEINGKKYGIVDTQAYYYPEPEKGNYIGEVNGMKVYEFVGNDKAVLIDLNRYVGIGGTTDEFLYVAELLN